MSKHTPGPWKLEYDGSLVIDGCVVSRPMGNDHAPREEKVANNRLMAAAPELLTALKGLAEFDGTFPDGEKMDAVDYKFNLEALKAQARAAIAKAEGK